MVLRSPDNPILVGESQNPWEAQGAFNGCPIKSDGKTHLIYRALSLPMLHEEIFMEVSTIGRAASKNGTTYAKHYQFIKPEHEWERYGCEDPRITKFGNKYYIFYTALSTYPFVPSGISIGLAISKDLKKIEQKYHITPFNSKAMALFPKKVKGKIAAILTANTDLPPAKIAVAYFDKIEQMWSREYWEKWYPELGKHVLELQRSPEDHIELGAPPIETKAGWLLVYCYIRNYTNALRTFGIEAVLLDRDNPQKVIGRTQMPLLVPQEEYELYGKVPNVIFPSGALVKGKYLEIYYGAADTTCCKAKCNLAELISELKEQKKSEDIFERSKNNPILSPEKKNAWESKAVFNPAALKIQNKFHLVYRAVSDDDTSVMGYASSSDGINFKERLKKPVYVPREAFEVKLQPGNSGCEDPRLTIFNGRIYMFYTAINAKESPRVAFSSTALKDFLRKNWKWDKPKVISPPGIDDKDACLFP